MVNKLLCRAVVIKLGCILESPREMSKVHLPQLYLRAKIRNIWRGTQGIENTSSISGVQPKLKTADLESNLLV